MLVMLKKKKKNGRKKIQNCSHRDDHVTNYVNLFEKLCKKWLKYASFSKINLATARKKIFEIFFQLSKFKIQIDYI